MLSLGIFVILKNGYYDYDSCMIRLLASLHCRALS